MIKVFLCGEGNNELGTRWHKPPGDDPGVIETLLRRTRPAGWCVARALDWRSIRKYRAGGGRNHPNHNDVHNVHGLVLRAYDDHCDMLVFVRDRDNEENRNAAIEQALASIGELGFADTYGYALSVVGGVATPTLEGWILCLLGRTRTDDMKPSAAERDLARASITLKSTAEYVEIAETRPLPNGDSSLARWLARVRTEFTRLIDGVVP